MVTAIRLRSWATRVVLALLALAAPPGLTAQSVAERDSLSQPSPPVAKVVARLDTVAGVPWPDPYAWLRDDQRQRPEMLDYLRSENKYTEAMTRHTGSLQELLFKEMVGHIKETDASVPERIGRYYYYTRTIKGRAVSHLLSQAWEPDGKGGDSPRREPAGPGPRLFPSGAP